MCLLRGLPPTNSTIGSTTEVLRKRIREERSIDVSEETAEVVVGGPKITVRRGVMFSNGCRGLTGLTSFVVDPDMLKRVLKHGVQAVLESEPNLTRWDTISIDYWYSQQVIDPFQIVGDGDWRDMCKRC